MGLNRTVAPADLPAGRKRIEIRDEIDKLDYDKEPLLTILMKLGKEPSGQMKFEHLSKERRPDWGGIVSYAGNWQAGAADDGTITVTGGEGWMYAEGDILKVPDTSDVNIYVQSVAGDVITGITWDNTSTIDFSGGATGANKLLSISNAFGIGSNRGTEKSHQPTSSYNYCQIIQHPYNVTETVQHIKMDAGGPELSENEEEAWLQHELSKEKTIFFGQKHLATTGYMTSGGNLAQYFTGGWLESVALNTITGAVITEADLSYQEFSDWIALTTKYAKNPLVVAGELVFGALPWWMGERGLETRQDETTLGISVSNFRTIYGQIVPVIAHRDLLINKYAGHTCLMDLDDLKYRYLDGEDTHIEKDIQTPGLKQTINEVRTWFGFYMGSPKRHGLVKDTTSISK